MKLLLALLLPLAACGDPVENCKEFPRSDCCTENAQCFDFYGADFPFCTASGRDIGGTCSECARDSDCPGSALCLPSKNGQKVCYDCVDTVLGAYMNCEAVEL